jgi:hypothetical protein
VEKEEAVWRAAPIAHDGRSSAEPAVLAVEVSWGAHERMTEAAAAAEALLHLDVEWECERQVLQRNMRDL